MPAEAGGDPETMRYSNSADTEFFSDQWGRLNCRRYCVYTADDVLPSDNNKKQCGRFGEKENSDIVSGKRDGNENSLFLSGKKTEMKKEFSDIADIFERINGLYRRKNAHIWLR